MFDESVSIRTISKWNVEYLGIFHCLLHTSTNWFVVVLGFDYSNRHIGLSEKQIVSFLSFLTIVMASIKNYSSISEVVFTTNHALSPSFTKNGRVNVF